MRALGFGTSTPTTFLPGTGAWMRRLAAFSTICSVLASPEIFSTLIPAAGSSS